MTSKMPEVGKRYKCSDQNCDWLEFVKFELSEDKQRAYCTFQRHFKEFENSKHGSGAAYVNYNLEYFWERFEELPNQEQKSQEKEEVQVIGDKVTCGYCEKDFVKKNGVWMTNCQCYDPSELIKFTMKLEQKEPDLSKTETTDTLSVAKEELRKKLNGDKENNPITYRIELHHAAQNLLNALDDQKIYPITKDSPQTGNTNAEEARENLFGNKQVEEEKKIEEEKLKPGEWIKTPYKPGTPEFNTWYKEKFGICPVKAEEVIKESAHDINSASKLPWHDLDSYPQEELLIMRLKDSKGSVYFGHFEEHIFHDFADEYEEDEMETENIEHISLGDFVNAFEQLQDKVEEMEKRLSSLEKLNQKEQEFYKKQCEKLEGRGR